jgi:hypothetical protein
MSEERILNGYVSSEVKQFVPRKNASMISRRVDRVVLAADCSCACGMAA